MTDTAFETWAFPATGASASRTLPDRLSDVRNVKDYGAVGDGVTDDLAAIMAAYNWTGGTNRGHLYFPPGTYYVSAPIDVSDLATSVHLTGQMGLSVIVGNFPDYIIKRYFLGSTPGGTRFIEALTIINQHASGGGIRLGSCVGGVIRDCDITANFCIDTDNSDVFGPPGDPNAYWGSLEISISNCNLRPYTALAAGSTGIARIADGPTTNCTFKNFDTAVRNYGGQGAMAYFGCYFETNNYGIAYATGPGTATIGASSGPGTVSVLGCHFKNNGIAIAYAAGDCKHAGILIEAEEGTISGNPQYGIYIGGGGNCNYSGVKVTGQFAVAGIYQEGGESTRSVASFEGVSVSNTSTALGAVAWRLPSTAMSIDTEGCNVASVWTVAKLPAKLYTIASATWSAGVATFTVVGGPGDLPSGNNANITIAGMTPSGYNGYFAGALALTAFTFSCTMANPGGSGTVMGTAFVTATGNGNAANAYEGDCYNVSDANTATWGNPVTAGGGSNHAKLRFTPAAWTVVGK